MKKMKEWDMFKELTERDIETIEVDLKNVAGTALMEAKRDESEFEQETLKKVPYPIYIG